MGRLGRPNGLDGYLGLYVDRADLVYFQPGSVVFVAETPYEVESTRQGTKGPQVRFAQVHSRDGAEAIRGNDVYAVQRRSLSDREYWPDDLTGLEVRPGGGVVTGVEHGAAQDRLIVRRGEAIFEVPFVDELVPVVDLAGGFVEVVEIPGLSSPPDRT